MAKNTTVKASSTPEDVRICYFISGEEYVEGKGYRAAIITENQPGYRLTGTWPHKGKRGEVMPYFWGRSLKKANEVAKEMNRRMGLSPEDVAKIVSSSMHGPQAVKPR